MYKKLQTQQYMIILSFLSIFLSIMINDLLFVIYNGSYPILFSLSLSLYAVGYFYVLLIHQNHLTTKSYIYIFLILKLYIFLYAVNDYDFAIHYLRFVNSDAGHYHIPESLMLHSFTDSINHLFSSSLEFNGRLTHVILYLNIEILNIFNFSHSYYNIALTSYISNTIINIITLVIICKILTIYYKYNYNMQRKALFFIAFNPFFIYYSMIAQKEALLFLTLSYLLLYIIQGKNRYLLISSLIFLFERPYMLGLSILIVFFIAKIKYYYKLLIIFVFLFIIEYYIGISTALNLHSHYLLSVKGNSSSIISINNWFIDIIKLLFGPAFIRPFLSSTVNDNIFYSLYYLFMPMYIYLSLLSFKYTNGIEKIIIISLFFVYLIAPFHGVLKLTIITVFLVIYVDKIRVKKLDIG